MIRHTQRNFWIKNLQRKRKCYPLKREIFFSLNGRFRDLKILIASSVPVQLLQETENKQNLFATTGNELSSEN